MSGQPWAGVDIRGKQLLFPEVDTDPFVGEHDWDKLTSTAFKAADINKENRKAAFAAYNAAMEDALKLEIPRYLTVGVGDKMEQVANPLYPHYQQTVFSLMDECANRGTGASTGDALASIQPCIAHIQKIRAQTAATAKSQSEVEKLINETYGADSPASVYHRRANLAYAQGNDPFAYTASGKPMATADLSAEAKKAIDMAPTFSKELMGQEQGAAVGGDYYRWLQSYVLSGKDPNALSRTAVLYAENSPAVLNSVKQMANDKAFNAKRAIDAGSQVPQTTLVEYSALLKKMDDLTAQGAAREDMTPERRAEFDKQYAELSGQLRQVQNGVLWDPEKGYMENETEAMYADAQMEKFYDLVVNGAYQKTETKRFGGQHDSTLESKLLNMAYRRQKMAEDKKKNAGGMYTFADPNTNFGGKAFGDDNPDDALAGKGMAAVASDYFGSTSMQNDINQRVEAAAINGGGQEAVDFIESLSGLAQRYGKNLFAGANEDEKTWLADKGIVQNESGQWTMAGGEGVDPAKRAEAAKILMAASLVLRRQDFSFTTRGTAATEAVGAFKSMGMPEGLANLLAHNSAGVAWSDGTRSGAPEGWVSSQTYAATDPTNKDRALDPEDYAYHIVGNQFERARPKILKSAGGAYLFKSTDSKEGTPLNKWMNEFLPHVSDETGKNQSLKRTYQVPGLDAGDFSLGAKWTSSKDGKTTEGGHVIAAYGTAAYNQHLGTLLQIFSRSEGTPDYEALRAARTASVANIPPKVFAVAKNAADSYASPGKTFTGDIGQGYTVVMEKAEGGVVAKLSYYDPNVSQWVTVAREDIQNPNIQKTMGAVLKFTQLARSGAREGGGGQGGGASQRGAATPDDVPPQRNYTAQQGAKSIVSLVNTKDGDTIEIAGPDGGVFRIDGLDAFEKNQTASTGQPIGYLARKRTKELIDGGYQIVEDARGGAYGRKLARVFVLHEGKWTDLADVLLSEGLGHALSRGDAGTQPPGKAATNATPPGVGR